MIKPRLGKGLSAILGGHPSIPAAPPAAVPATQPSSDVVPAGGENVGVGVVRSLPVERIIPNPRQPRTLFDDTRLAELADSIRASGVIQPVIVRPVPGDRFELVAGERRLRAAKVAQLTAVPALVREMSDAESLEFALVENLQREDLNAIDRAAAYQHYLQTFRVAPDTLARRLGESRANIANYLRLLALAGEIQEMVRTGTLSMGHARAIAGIKEPERQLYLARLVARKGLSVRQTEALAGDAEASAPAAAPRSDRHMEDVERAFRKATGLPVVVRPGRKKNSGKITIAYRTLEEFDALAEKLGARSYLE